MDGDGLLRIGCILKPIAWWLENNVRCGEDHGYTPRADRRYGGTSSWRRQCTGASDDQPHRMV
jgi:hypothetical protein